MTRTETCPEALPMAAAEAEAARAENWTESFTPFRLVLLIGACVFALYPEVVLGTHSFFDRDFGLFTYPLAHYARESLWRGEIPLWNPLSNCGIPFLAQWNTTTCYPPSWFYFLLPLPWSLHYFLFAHLIIAGLGMYFLAMRWQANRFGASVAGMIYAQNGFIFNCLMWPSNLAALAWLPWVVLSVERAWCSGGTAILAAALVGALQMLAGSPEITGMTWLIAGSLWLVRVWEGAVVPAQSLRRSCAVLSIIIGLSAVQLLPFLEFISESNRRATVVNSTWSMPAWGVANFILPLFRTEQSILGSHFQVEQQWTSSYYLGIAAVVLAIAALAMNRSRLNWWLGGLAFTGLLLALGEHTPFYPIVAKALPAIRIARYPVKFVALAVFAVPLLASYAAGNIGFAGRKEPRRLVWVAGSVIVCIGLLIVISHGERNPKLSWNALASNGLTRCALLTLIIPLLLLLKRTTDLARARKIGFAILLALGIDAVTHMPRQNPTVPNQAYGPLNLMMEKPVPGVSRAMVNPSMQALLARSSMREPLMAEVGNRRSLFEDSNLIDGVPKVNGFYPVYLSWQADIDALLYNPTNAPSGLVDFLGVTQISSEKEFWKWEPWPSGMPLITAGQQPVFVNSADTLQALRDPAFDGRGIVYLPEDAKGLGAVSRKSSALICNFSIRAHEVSADVVAQGDAIVVIAQTFSRQWKAFVDGTPAPLWRANHAFQATQVSAGKHHVRLIYRDAGFVWGAWISIGTMVICALGWMKLRSFKSVKSDGSN